MTTEEIVDAARNAGFSSSEITRRIAAFKRLIQYSTSAEREKCTGTQEFVTLPSEVVGQALEAFAVLLTYNTSSTEYAAGRSARDALRAALERPQNHAPGAWNMVPAGWKLVPVEPNEAMHRAAVRTVVHCTGNDDFPPAVYRAMLAAAPQPPVVEQPQAEQLAMTPIAQRKLDSLLTEGYTISGYSVYHEQKHQHGFVTGAGLVGWWRPEGMEYPQQQGEPSTLAFCHVGDVVVCDNDSLLRQLGVKRSDKLYLHPQDLNCKSKQALLATLWGYTKEQPKRPPLTDNQIDKIAESVPGGLEGFLKGWGWRQFARAVLENDHNIK